MTREEFLEEAKKLKFPVLMQEKEQLAERREESLEEMNKAISENIKKKAKGNHSSTSDIKNED